jgi:cell division protease FtsH
VSDREKPPTTRPPRPPEGSPGAAWRQLLPYAVLALLLFVVWQYGLEQFSFRTISYRDFKQYLAAGEVTECEVAPDTVRGRIEPKASKQPAEGAKPAEAAKPSEAAEVGEASKAGGGPQAFLFRAVRVDDPDLIHQLEAAGIDYSGYQPSSLPQLLLVWALPIGLLALLWFGVFRRMGSPGQAVMTFGKSRARLVADKDVGVTFDDVAGCVEAKTELREIVEFLRSPERFTALGAKIPKGVLLVGPPGTGKTLLARAVAGEAKVPFFSLSGSDFVEMFVGVGAARVRDLFVEAKSHAPCIVFIDELDAIGRARGVHLSNINDEREHTLNQLLVEMDGFEANTGVILLSATNRPDVLDPALLRPGRFDRQVVLDAPDVDGREAILRVHVRGKRMAKDVDLRAVARATAGLSGADLANAVNEAALLAARRGADRIAEIDLEEAVEKVVAGPERKSRRLEAEVKRRVAYHEVGHALVAAYSKHADPVRKISIVPRGRAALGYTLQLPTGDQYLLSRSELLDRIKGLLGGRAAEELVLAEVSTGAENDLQQATALARRLVCQFGMGEAVGLMHCAQPDTPALLAGEVHPWHRECSDDTAHAIDVEVKSLLDQLYREAQQILREHRDELDRVARALLDQETLDEATLNRLIAGQEAHVHAAEARQAPPSKDEAPPPAERRAQRAEGERSS